MTTAELIAELRKWNPDTEVRVANTDTMAFEPVTIVSDLGLGGCCYILSEEKQK